MIRRRADTDLAQHAGQPLDLSARRRIDDRRTGRPSGPSPTSRARRSSRPDTRITSKRRLGRSNDPTTSRLPPSETERAPDLAAHVERRAAGEREARRPARAPGAPGPACRYAGRKSWPHSTMQCASSTASRVTGTDRRRRSSHSLASRSGAAYSSRSRPAPPRASDVRLVHRRRRAVQRRGGDAPRRERRHLVLHQRDERRDDDRQARLEQCRHLVAHRLAAAGWQHRQHVAPAEHVMHDAPLHRAEIGMAEGGPQHVARQGERSRHARHEAPDGGEEAVPLRRDARAGKRGCYSLGVLGRGRRRRRSASRQASTTTSRAMTNPGQPRVVARHRHDGQRQREESSRRCAARSSGQERRHGAAEVGRGPRHRVDARAEEHAGLEVLAVEFDEELLGQREGAGTLPGKGGEQRRRPRRRDGRPAPPGSPGRSASASAASTVRPVATSSKARFSPASRRNIVITIAGTNPREISG